ncbi:hypothetical protein [Streptomyces griseorubiginosus]|uniref:hypothetical protein n=1 Tax=Streptomyces griseorubiginosus TaxID=67304 RepID=UPI003669B6EA
MDAAGDPLAQEVPGSPILDQHQSKIAITGAGSDVWGGGGQHNDQYGAVCQGQSFGSGTTVTVKVDQLDDANP